MYLLKGCVFQPLVVSRMFAQIIEGMPLTFLRATTSRSNLLLPHERATTDNTADDILHNDIIDWLRNNEVGWPRDEFDTIGRVFVSRSTTSFSPLTSCMFTAMSDAHNACTCLSCLCYSSMFFATRFVSNGSPMHDSAVKPYPCPSLEKRLDRKKNGAKGKQAQQRLETSMIAFDAAFTNTQELWRKSGNLPTLLTTIENLFKSVKHYNNR